MPHIRLTPTKRQGIGRHLCGQRGVLQPSPRAARGPTAPARPTYRMISRVKGRHSASWHRQKSWGSPCALAHLQHEHPHGAAQGQPAKHPCDRLGLPCVAAGVAPRQGACASPFEDGLAIQTPPSVPKGVLGGYGSTPCTPGLLWRGHDSNSLHTPLRRTEVRS